MERTTWWNALLIVCSLHVHVDLALILMMHVYCARSSNYFERPQLSSNSVAAESESVLIIDMKESRHLRNECMDMYRCIFTV